MNQIYNGDCLEIMKGFEDNYFDLVLTDPPYGIGADKGIGGGSMRGKVKKYNDNWDNYIPSKEYFNEIFRVSKNQMIFGGNYFVEHLKNSSCWLVWDKRQGLPQRTFADAEIIWTSFKSPVRMFRFKWDGMIQENMKHKEEKFHPTQKPVELIIKILKKYSNDGDKILDPFCGSGSILLAAEKMGLKWAGVDKEKEYCEIAQKRIDDYNKQLRLF